MTPRLPWWVPDLDRPRSITVLRWCIGIVLALSLLAFVVRGADNPKDPYLAPPGAAPASLSQPVGMM